MNPDFATVVKRSRHLRREIGTALAAARAARGMTKRELAALLHMTIPTILRAERGVGISLRTLVRMTVFLGMDLRFDATSAVAPTTVDPVAGDGVLARAQVLLEPPA